MTLVHAAVVKSTRNAAAKLLEADKKGLSRNYLLRPDFLWRNNLNNQIVITL